MIFLDQIRLRSDLKEYNKLFWIWYYFFSTSYVLPIPRRKYILHEIKIQGSKVWVLSKDQSFNHCIQLLCQSVESCNIYNNASSIYCKQFSWNKTVFQKIYTVSLTLGASTVPKYFQIQNYYLDSSIIFFRKNVRELLNSWSTGQY